MITGKKNSPMLDTSVEASAGAGLLGSKHKVTVKIPVVSCHYYLPRPRVTITVTDLVLWWVPYGLATEVDVWTTCPESSHELTTSRSRVRHSNYHGTSSTNSVIALYVGKLGKICRYVGFFLHEVEEWKKQWMIRAVVITKMSNWSSSYILYYKVDRGNSIRTLKS